jgi:cation:H+ antiporter
MMTALFQWFVEFMSMWPAVAIFVLVGIAGLKYGADWLVDGASNLGFRIGMSAATVGLTIVAFGTSAPELVVSVLTALRDKPEICLGNVIGSNIANTALILGATAVIFPINVPKSARVFDGPLSFAAIALVFVLALIGSQISRLDGVILLTVFFSWMGWVAIQTFRKKKANEVILSEIDENATFTQRAPSMDVVLVVVGLIALIGGADALVASAEATAVHLGIAPVVVGLTVVAVGTSLPELAVSIMASLKHQADITVGNVFGSNIFNALLILGVCTIIAPINFNISSFAWTGDPGTLYIDIPFCVFVCALVMPMMWHRNSLGRFKGVFLLALYVGYLTTLVLRQGW